MKRKCTKCKKNYIIMESDLNPKTYLPYNYCGKCRERNRKEIQRKKEKLIQKSTITNKKYCTRCQIEFNTNGKRCTNCKDYANNHIKLKRDITKKITTNTDKYCSKCCNKMDITNTCKTCENCRDIDKKNYNKHKNSI